MVHKSNSPLHTRTELPSSMTLVRHTALLVRPQFQHLRMFALFSAAGVLAHDVDPAPGVCPGFATNFGFLALWLSMSPSDALFPLGCFALPGRFSWSIRTPVTRVTSLRNAGD